MLDLVDHLLLRRGIALDDCSLAFRRIEGNPRSKVVYFLPLQTSFSVARQAAFLPLDFLAAYEMPNAIASSEPDLCLQAMLALANDAHQLLIDHNVAAGDAVIVGLSAGSYPATYLANRIGARLCSVASADRIDLLIWESPAARIVRRRASQKGYVVSHYTSTLEGSHPAQNLRGLAPRSLFVVGRRDPFIPTGRMNGLLAAVEAHAPCCHVVRLAAGHVATMMLSGRHQRCLSGVTARSPAWRLLDLGGWRSALAQPAALGSLALGGVRAGGAGN
jgi:hypothetical protein